MSRKWAAVPMLAVAAAAFYLGFLRPWSKHPTFLCVLHDGAGRNRGSLFSTARLVGIERRSYLRQPLAAPPGMNPLDWWRSQTYDHASGTDYGIVTVERGLPLVPDTPDRMTSPALCVGYRVTVGLDRSAFMLTSLMAGGGGLWLIRPRRRQ